MNIFLNAGAIILVASCSYGCATNTISATTSVSDQGIAYSKAISTFSEGWPEEQEKQFIKKLNRFKETEDNKEVLQVFAKNVVASTEANFESLKELNKSSLKLKNFFETLKQLSESDYSEKNSAAMNGLVESINKYNKESGISKQYSKEESDYITKIFNVALTNWKSGKISEHVNRIAKPMALVLTSHANILNIYRERTKRHNDLELLALENNLIGNYTEKRDASSVEDDMDDIKSLLLDNAVMSATGVASESMKNIWYQYVSGELTGLESMDADLKEISSLLESINGLKHSSGNEKEKDNEH